MKDMILSKREAERAIRNFKERVKTIAKGFGGKETGILYSSHRLFAQIDEAVRTFSAKAVGSAIEEVADEVGFEEPWLYYASRFDSSRDKEQEDYVEDFIDELNAFAEELQDELDEQEAERARSAEEQQQLEHEYGKQLKNLRSLVTRRVGKGLQTPYTKFTPPKKITEGSLRRVLGAIENLKTNYPL